MCRRSILVTQVYRMGIWPVTDSVAEFEATEGHSHPTLDISWQEHERLVLDDEFKIGAQNSSTRFRFVLDEKTSSNWAFVSYISTLTTRSWYIFWCLSSWRDLTSDMADMSRSSLNWPTLIFLIATFLLVAISQPDPSALLPLPPASGGGLMACVHHLSAAVVQWQS